MRFHIRELEIVLHLQSFLRRCACAAVGVDRQSTQPGPHVTLSWRPDLRPYGGLVFRPGVDEESDELHEHGQCETECFAKLFG